MSTNLSTPEPWFQDPDGGFWYLHDVARHSTATTTAMLGRSPQPSPEDHAIVLPFGWDEWSEPLRWYVTAPSVPVDKLGRLAGGSAPSLQRQRMISALIEADWNGNPPPIDMVDSEDVTALMRAVVQEDQYIVQMLIQDLGASPRVTSYLPPPPSRVTQMTPLAMAERQANPWVLLPIVASGKLNGTELRRIRDGFVQRAGGFTPFAIACAELVKAAKQEIKSLGGWRP